ncbi:Na+/H+ antiporter subunit E [Natronincola ferrireducens]|uniref:Multisubunit sodium/proton antiporter, MrpE subunit n=1 Tax=Natronincola ferrireducens TaxID=393762 RepID=A0A1G9G4K3_9FIRM|nr:Na+/H+ antiporter subunit E [Natronincola ferrireducens]SDK95527.1 multisubunit sodium/proton antiporter, MrpE subunit [Natronincola ferrireducens]
MKDKQIGFTPKNIYLFIPLFLFWLVLSPRLSTEAVVSGIIVSLIIVIYSKDIAFSHKEMPLYYGKKFLLFLKFIGRLLVEIVKANIEVAMVVLNPSLPISPKFVKVPMMLKNDVMKTIYGNSVTLTPGTLTVDVTEGDFVIHALTEDAAEAMKGSIIEKYCILMEEEKK